MSVVVIMEDKKLQGWQSLGEKVGLNVANVSLHKVIGNFMPDKTRVTSVFLSIALAFQFCK